nr:type II secretion system protein GspD [Lautropia sp.]
MSRLSRELAKYLIIAWALLAVPAVVHSDEPITLNFKDAEIDSVIGAFGHLLNRTFVIDPRVRGKISLETPRPVTRELAFTLLKTVLRQQGFAVVDIGTLVKVVPEADAKLQSGPVETSRVMSRTGDEIVTQIFQLNHESATNMIPVLRPLVSPNNTITAFPNNNSLVITDYAANVTRLARIIANLDNPRAGNDVQVVQINHSIATDVAVAVSRLLDETTRAGSAPGAVVDPGQRVTVLSDPRTNTVLLRTSSAAKMRLAQSLITQLDQPASGEQANMRVVYLRNAEAVKLVEVLRAVLSGDQSAASGLSPSRNPNPQGGALS